MQNLNHKNVLKMIEFNHGNYLKRNGIQKYVAYIVFEICSGGELFEFIAVSGAFSEKLARYYFK
jgi:serine/threonine protein kinase